MRHADSAPNSFLIKEINTRLQDRLEQINQNFDHVLNLGAQRAPLKILADHITRADAIPGKGIDKVFEEDFMPSDLGMFDLIYHGFGLHFVNDLPGALIQIRKRLNDKSVFLGALLGGETLYELRQSLMQAEMELKDGAGPRISPMADLPDMAALMQRAGFALPVIDSDLLTVTYRNMTALMKDVREMGEANIVTQRQKGFTSKRLFDRAEEIYREKFSEDGLLHASFRVIYVMGWSS